MFELCTICLKPLVNYRNLIILRTILISSGVGVVALGGTLMASLPAFIGFGASGIASGSIAASWQSSMGIIVAGSLFATLQSLGTTGMATLLFGSIGTVASGTGALYLLNAIASSLNWCEC